jgi:hypothetical protein
MAKKTTKKPAVRTKSRKAAAPKGNKQTLAQLLAMPTSRSSRTPPAPQMVRAHTRNASRPQHGGRPQPDSYKMPSQQQHPFMNGANEQAAFASLFGGAPVTHFVVEGPGELLELMQLLETDAAQNCPCGNCAARRAAEQAAAARASRSSGERIHDFGFRSGQGPQQPPMSALNQLIMEVAALADAQHGLGGRLVAQTTQAIGV